MVGARRRPVSAVLLVFLSCFFFLARETALLHGERAGGMRFGLCVEDSFSV